MTMVGAKVTETEQLALGARVPVQVVPETTANGALSAATVSEVAFAAPMLVRVNARGEEVEPTGRSPNAGLGVLAKLSSARSVALPRRGRLAIWPVVPSL